MFQLGKVGSFVIKAIQRIGDRLLSKVVPEVPAAAWVLCGCWPDEKGRKLRFIKTCDTCLCYESGAC